MSQSTIIVVETGLDKFELFCGSRGPAELLGIEVGNSKTYYDAAATITLSRMPNAGAGRQALFTALINQARATQQLYHSGWLKVTVSRHD